MLLRPCPGPWCSIIKDFSDPHGRVTTLAPAVLPIGVCVVHPEKKQKANPSESEGKTVSGFGTRPAILAICRGALCPKLMPKKDCENAVPKPVWLLSQGPL